MRPAAGSLRETGAATARLLLGGLDEGTAFVEFDAACDAGIVLGCDWLRAHWHDLNVLYDSRTSRTRSA